MPSLSEAFLAQVFSIRHISLHVLRHQTAHQCLGAVAGGNVTKKKHRSANQVLLRTPQKKILGGSTRAEGRRQGATSHDLHWEPVPHAQGHCTRPHGSSTNADLVVTNSR